VKHLEPTIPFDFDALDPEEPIELDQAFWSAQGEFLATILAWLTEPHGVSRIGARTCVLTLYLRPELLNQRSLAELSRLPGCPSKAGLSKAMLQLQERYCLHLGAYQKERWMRERYRRSAIVAHQTHKVE
jgi:hypothetical protein